MGRQENIEDIYPLNSMQEGILFHSIYQKNTSVYMVQLSFRLRMNLEFPLVEKSLNELMQRHDVLRTAFIHEGRERPLQIVLKKRSADLFYHDFSDLPPGKDRESLVAEIKAKDRRRYFDFVKDPLLRIGIMKLDNAEYEFIWSFHHILMDGWCLGIIISEFFRIYESLHTRSVPRLPEVKPYKIYIQWLEKQDKEASKHYWRNYLKQYEGLAQIPRREEAGEPAEGYRSTDLVIQFPPEKTAALNKLARENKVTVSTVFQSLWGILLGRYTNRNDVVFGAVVSGRPAGIDGVESMVGLFINTVPVRISYENHIRWIDLLKKVQEDALQSEIHHYYPLGDIQTESGLKQNLLDHILAFENFPVADRLLQLDSRSGQGDDNGFSILRVDVFEQTNYDLNVTIIPEDRLRITFKYNANAYKENNLRRLGEHLENVFTQLIGNEEMEIGRIELISHREKTLMLQDLNDTQADYPQEKTVHGCFQEQVSQVSFRTAMVSEDLQFTYDELNSMANRLARFLRSKGVYSDTLVGLCLTRSFHLIAAILGVIKAGGAYLPIDPEYPRDRVSYMLQDCNAKMLLANGDVDPARLPTTEIIDVDDLAIGRQDESDPHSVNEAGDLLYVIYTSGTTGKPKGVMIDHRNVVRLLFNDRFLFSFGRDDIWTMFHSYCFDFSVWEMYGALLYGGKLILVSRPSARDPVGFLKLLRREQVSVLNQIPSAFYHLAAEEAKEKRKELCIRYVIFGGEALHPAKLRNWKEKYPETLLINMFGITETTVHVTFKKIGDREIETNVSNIGRPLPTLTTYVLDGNLRFLPIGIAGELCVGGDGLGRGYLNHPDLSDRKFVVNPYRSKDRLYRSGDLGKFTDTGEMEYLGRIDHQLKIRGFRIEPDEIESMLLTHPHITEVVVLARDDENGKYLCAYFTAEAKKDAGELRTFLQGQLPDYMIPAYFIQVKRMPLSPSGKIDRRALPELNTFSRDFGEPCIDPRNETEAGLVEIWTRVLVVDRIGVRDNFFNIGGDSMKSIRILSLINGRFGTALNVADIYAHDTIEALAERIDRGTEETGYKELEGIYKEFEVLKERILREEKRFPAQVEDIYPVSDMEMGTLFYYLKDPDNAFFHEQFVYQLTYPDFNQDIFEKALRLMMTRHENLRAYFNLEDFGQPVKIVLKEFSVEFRYTDLSGFNRREQEVTIKNIIDEDRRQLFDIKTPPLWKVMVFYLGGEEICLLVIFHHAIMDGWSNASFMAELNGFYFQLKEQPDFKAERLTVSYKDFVARQIMEKNRDENKNFWKTELDGYRKLTLFGDRQGTDGSGYTDSCSLNLGTSCLDTLRLLAKQHNTSTKNLCFAAFLIAMKLFAPDNDVVVGIATNPRPVLEDSDKVLGMFVSTIPFRIKVPIHIKWLDFIKLVDRKMAELKKYEKVSLFEILRIIGEKQKEISPIFDTVFNYVDFHVYDFSSDHNQITVNNQLSLDSYQNSNNPFNLSINTTFGELLIDLNYSTSVFSPNLIRQICEYYKDILFCMIERPGMEIREVAFDPLANGREPSTELLAATSEVRKINFQF